MDIVTGFDASAHMSEETKNASWSAPIGVISSVGFSALFGFFVVMTYLFSIQDFDRTVNSVYGQPILQIFVDIAGENGALGLFSVIISELASRAPRMYSLVDRQFLSLRLALRTVQHDQQQPHDVCLCPRRWHCKSNIHGVYQRMT